MIEIVHVSSRGQIVIPEKVRKRLGISEGTKLVLLERKDGLELRREEDIVCKLDEEKKESLGWFFLAQKSLKDVWDNPKDEKIWKKYL